MMRRVWGEVSATAWQAAFDRYGERVIMTTLRQALQRLTASPQQSIDALVNHMKIEQQLAEVLVKETAPDWLHNDIFTNQP